VEINNRQLEEQIRKLDPRLAYLISKVANLYPNELEIVKVATLIRIAEATEKAVAALEDTETETRGICKILDEKL
jgi:hypothetical protein